MASSAPKFRFLLPLSLDDTAFLAIWTQPFHDFRNRGARESLQSAVLSWRMVIGLHALFGRDRGVDVTNALLDRAGED